MQAPGSSNLAASLSLGGEAAPFSKSPVQQNEQQPKKEAKANEIKGVPGTRGLNALEMIRAHENFHKLCDTEAAKKLLLGSSNRSAGLLRDWRIGDEVLWKKLAEQSINFTLFIASSISHDGVIKDEPVFVYFDVYLGSLYFRIKDPNQLKDIKLIPAELNPSSPEYTEARKVFEKSFFDFLKQPNLPVSKLTDVNSFIDDFVSGDPVLTEEDVLDSDRLARVTSQSRRTLLKPTPLKDYTYGGFTDNEFYHADCDSVDAAKTRLTNSQKTPIGFFRPFGEGDDVSYLPEFLGEAYSMFMFSLYVGNKTVDVPVIYSETDKRYFTLPQTEFENYKSAPDKASFFWDAFYSKPQFWVNSMSILLNKMQGKLLSRTEVVAQKSGPMPGANSSVGSVEIKEDKVEKEGKATVQSPASVRHFLNKKNSQPELAGQLLKSDSHEAKASGLAETKKSADEDWEHVEPVSNDPLALHTDYSAMQKQTFEDLFNASVVLENDLTTSQFLVACQSSSTTSTVTTSAANPTGQSPAPLAVSAAVATLQASRTVATSPTANSAPVGNSTPARAPLPGFDAVEEPKKEDSKLRP